MIFKPFVKKARLLALLNWFIDACWDFQPIAAGLLEKPTTLLNTCFGTGCKGVA